MDIIDRNSDGTAKSVELTDLEESASEQFNQYLDEGRSCSNAWWRVACDQRFTALSASFLLWLDEYTALQFGHSLSERG